MAVYESGGTGAEVLLIHGRSMNAQTFRHQLDGDFGDKHRVVAFDLPGHGASSQAANPEKVYSPQGFAPIVTKVVDRIKMFSPVVVGWSLGGGIALEAYDQLPNTAGLFIFGAPPLGNPPAIQEVFLPNLAMRLILSHTLTEDEAMAVVESLLWPGAIPPTTFRTAILQADGKMRAQLAAGAGERKNSLNTVANMTVPLAIVHGVEDQLVNIDYIRGLEMPTLWCGEIQFIEGAGHSPHWEQPDRFNALLANFVAEVTEAK